MNQQQAHALPEGWVIEILGNLGIWRGGGTPSTRNDEYWLNGYIPWVSPKDMKTMFIDSAEDLITEIAVKYSTTSLIPTNSILIVTRSGILRSYVPVAKNICPVTINQDLKALTVSADFSVDYVLQYLISNDQNLIKQTAKVGSTVESLDFQSLKEYEIPLPPLPEQRQIADVLSTWDRAVEQTGALLGQLRTRHRGLMQRLLTGKVRLPGFAGEWRHVEFGDVFERVNRRNFEGNTNVLTISAQQGLISQGRYFNKSIASEDVANYFLLHKGEFAYNKSYSAGYPMGAMKRLEQYEKGILSPLYICFRVTNEIDNDATFFTHYFEGGYMNRAISEIAQEGARNHGLLNVGVNDFFGLRLIIPTVEEQQAIAAVLDTSLREIRQQEAQLSSLREQKRGLMQNLLTGKVRVPLPVEVA